MAHSENPTIRKMVAAYLAEHDYDGLRGDGCACGIGNLFTCSDPAVNLCAAGYRTACDGDCNNGLFVEVPAPCDFHMVEDRRKVRRYTNMTEAELAAGRARRKELLK